MLEKGQMQEGHKISGEYPRLLLLMQPLLITFDWLAPPLSPRREVGRYTDSNDSRGVNSGGGR
jgi:hypothetical protein